MSGALKRVGNSLALFVPAAEVRRARLREGQTVEAVLRPVRPELLGLLKGVLPYEPYERRKEGIARDRL